MGSKPKYPPELYARLEALRAASIGETDWEGIAEKIAAEFGIPMTNEKCRNIYKRHFGSGKKKDDEKEKEHSLDERISTIIHTQKKSAENLSLDEWGEVLQMAKSVNERISIRQLTADVAIDRKTPIALSFTGDLHLGGAHTNHAAIFEHAKFIASDPRIYVGISGDRIESFTTNFKDKRGPVHQLQPIQNQYLIMEQYLKTLDGSVIAAIGGNHDIMVPRDVGVDPQYFILRDFEFPYLPHGGLIRLTIGSVTFKILWKHHYRFNSQLNQFNSHHRMLEMLVPTADIVVTEHEHNPGVESVERGEFDDRRTVVSIRTGAYKEDDGYSMDYFKAGRIAPQTVVLYPDVDEYGQKRIVAFHGRHSLYDAAYYLDGVGVKK